MIDLQVLHDMTLESKEKILEDVGDDPKLGTYYRWTSYPGVPDFSWVVTYTDFGIWGFDIDVGRPTTDAEIAAIYRALYEEE